MKNTSDCTILSRWIDEANSVTTICHARPDGDAAGSSVAMESFLREMRGKDAACILPDDLPRTLGFLSEGHKVFRASRDMEAAQERIRRSDLLICLDFNTPGRTEKLEDCVRGFGGRKVVIDHHEDPEEGAFDLYFSDTQVSSTCELLYEVLCAMPDTGGLASGLPADCAAALMTGMTTDTNNFANSVFPGTLKMASELLEAGVDRDGIIRKLYRSERPNRLAAQGEMLSSLMKIEKEGYAVTVLTKDFFTRHGLLDGETEGFVNLPLSVEGVALSILAKEDGGVFRVSLRSEKGVSAKLLAKRHFHGGGHEQAAGGRILVPEDAESPEAVEDYIRQTTARFLQEQDSAI